MGNKVYSVLITPNSIRYEIMAKDEVEAQEIAMNLANNGEYDSWDLFHHCDIDTEEIND